MSAVDLAQIEKYKKMLGLTNLNNTTDKTVMVASTTINGMLYVSSIMVLQNDVSTMNLNVLNDLNANQLSVNNIEINSSIVNNITVGNDLVSNNIFVDGSIAINNDSIFNKLNIYDVNVSNNSYISNNITCGSINTHSTMITILSDNIKIGHEHSNITIDGTIVNATSTDIELRDKYFILNNDYVEKDDIGNNAGFLINTTGTAGFIKTNESATRYEIITPNDTTTRYIATLDNNNNLIISGTTFLHGNVTILSNLLVSNDATISGDTLFNSLLNISGNSTFNDTVTCLSTVNVNGNITIENDTNCNSDLYIDGIANFQNVNISNDMNINNNTNIYGNVTIGSSLNIYGETLLGGTTTVGQDLIVSKNMLLNSSLTGLSDLTINGTTNVAGNIVVNNNLNISNTTLFNGNSTMVSSLYVSDDIIISGDVTLGEFVSTYSSFIENHTNFNQFEIFSQIVTLLPNYLNNEEAVTNGVPLWGFYRTGGILKIRLDDTPPSIVLTGNSSITININSNYYEPGGVATDNVDSNLNVYLTSISNTTTSNIITNNYTVSNETLITETSTLSAGVYTVDYLTTDSSGNTTTAQRTLTVSNILVSNNFNNIQQYADTATTGQFYTKVGDDFVNGVDVTWTLSNNDILFNFNDDWSFIVKVRAATWNGVFQINIDPVISNLNGLNAGVSRISFQDSFQYFSGDTTYWNDVTPPSNFFSEFTSVDGLYIKIDRVSTYLRISFFDNSGALLDEQISKIPFFYSNNNNLLSFYTVGDFEWKYGYALYEKNPNISVSIFKNIFEI